MTLNFGCFGSVENETISFSTLALDEGEDVIE